MPTKAQRRAVQTYRDKQKSRGFISHQVFATVEQWEVLHPVIVSVKNLDCKHIKQVDVDDDGKFIRFIYDIEPETRVVLSNQGQDDKL